MCLKPARTSGGISSNFTDDTEIRRVGKKKRARCILLWFQQAWLCIYWERRSKSPVRFHSLRRQLILLNSSQGSVNHFSSNCWWFVQSRNSSVPSPPRPYKSDWILSGRHSNMQPHHFLFAIHFITVVLPKGNAVDTAHLEGFNLIDAHEIDRVRCVFSSSSIVLFW